MEANREEEAVQEDLSVAVEVEDPSVEEVAEAAEKEAVEEPELLKIKRKNSIRSSMTIGRKVDSRNMVRIVYF